MVFLGHERNVRDQLETAEIFVIASNFGGLPNALMEAMAVGIPCVGTDCPCGGPKELAKIGEEIYLVPVGDKDSFENALIRLIENPSEEQKLAKRGKREQRISA